MSAEIPPTGAGRPVPEQPLDVTSKPTKKTAQKEDRVAAQPPDSVDISPEAAALELAMREKVEMLKSAVKDKQPPPPGSTRGDP